VPEGETAREALRRIRDQLRAGGAEEGDLEAELLLRQVLREARGEFPSRAWLYQRLDERLDASKQEALALLAGRRLGGEPSAYITGVREFRGLDFEVSPEVLIPRPETELVVEKAIAWVRGNLTPGPSPRGERGVSGRASPVIADVGTGSGVIAVCLAKALPAANVIATDVSWGALAVARRNAARHGVERRISFRHGDLLMPVDCYVDLILANLPYVTAADWQDLAPEVREHEPAVALQGGEDGLDLVRALLKQAPRYLRAGGSTCLEFGAGQAEALRACARTYLPGCQVEMFEDFGGIPRVLVAQL
jgi:release factor glutamine methyltransferase